MQYPMLDVQSLVRVSSFDAEADTNVVNYTGNSVLDATLTAIAAILEHSCRTESNQSWISQDEP